MASVTKQSIQDFKAQARSIDWVQTVEVWNNQLDRILAGETDVIIPGVFFERLFDPALQLLMGVKQVDFLLNIHILHNQVDAGDGDRADNTDIFDLRDAVVRKFTGFKATGCGVLQYAGEQEDFNHNNVYHYIVTFKAAMVDTTGTPWDEDNDKWKVKDPPTDLKLNIDIEPPYTKNLS